MKFLLRDILWLTLIIAVALGWWQYRVARDRQLAALAHEVKFLHSAGPPLEVVDEELVKCISFLSAAHGIRIDLDWESLEKVGYTRSSKVTRNLQEGSLRFVLHLLFEANADVLSTPEGLKNCRKAAAQEGAAMKLNLRDALWLFVLLILLFGWFIDWRFTQVKTATLTEEIQQLRSAPPPIQFVNTDFQAALWHLEWRLHWSEKDWSRKRVKMNLDWPSLRQAGVLYGRTKVTCRIDENAVKESIEQMLPGKVVVTPTPEGFDVRGRIDK